MLIQYSFPKDDPFAASWVWSFLLAIPPLLGFGAFSVEENGMGCAPSWKAPEDFDYNIALLRVGFFLPLSIITLTSADIYFLIHKVF